MNLCYKKKETKKIKKIEKAIAKITFPVVGTIGGKVFHKLLEKECEKRR